MRRFPRARLVSYGRPHRGARTVNDALRRVNDLLEEQTRRISRELHDESSQILAAVHLALDEAARDLPPASSERLDRVRRLLDEVQEQLRRLSHELHPTLLDDFGLLPALRYLCRGVAARTGLTIELNGLTGGRLPPEVETALYRVVQEGLNNVARHARASRVIIHLERSDGRLCCAIRDDGAGFRPTPRARRDGSRGLGIEGMRARLAAIGGTLRIDAAPGRGTELKVTVPMEACHAAANPPE